MKTGSPKIFKPFPQHTTYHIGTIKPKNVNQVQLDNAVKNFYNFWKSKYLKQNPLNLEQYFVFYNIDGTSLPRNAVSVSESHGHGMLATAIMAGYDQNAKQYFDGLYRFYKAHPSINNSSLMGWQQIMDVYCNIVDNPDGGNDSATDGDMDIAYALLLADSQWGSKGTINYLNEAKGIITAIMKNEVNQTEWILKLGDWVNDNNQKYGSGTRTSDFMISHLKAFENMTGDHKWNKVTNKIYDIVNNLFHCYSLNTGLLPDFSIKHNSHYKPAPPFYLETPYDGDYNWNACRTPWRLSIDYLLTGDKRELPLLRQLNTWIKIKTGENPYKIRAGYYLNGCHVPRPFNNSLAFIAPFATSAMIDSRNQEWLNKLWNRINTFIPYDNNYYSNSIKLLCMIVLSGNWWFPQKR